MEFKRSEIDYIPGSDSDDLEDKKHTGNLPATNQVSLMDISEVLPEITNGEPKPFKEIAEKEKVGSTVEKLLPSGKKWYSAEELRKMFSSKELCELYTDDELSQMLTPQQLIRMFTVGELIYKFTDFGLRQMLTEDQLSLLIIPYKAGARERVSMSLKKQAVIEAIEAVAFIQETKEILKEARKAVAEVLLTIGWNHVLLLVWVVLCSAYVVGKRIMSSFVQVFVSMV